MASLNHTSWGEPRERWQSKNLRLHHMLTGLTVMSNSLSKSQVFQAWHILGKTLVLFKILEFQASHWNPWKILELSENLERSLKSPWISKQMVLEIFELRNFSMIYRAPFSNGHQFAAHLNCQSSLKSWWSWKVLRFFYLFFFHMNFLITLVYSICVLQWF